MTVPPRERRERLTDIDAAKGLGMLLVVYGHLVQFHSPGESAWYAVSRDAIYSFHMPFFMYLSGFVFFLTRSQYALSRNYGKFVGARFNRLMVPFIVFGLLVIFGKYYASRFGEVHHAVNQIGDGIRAVVSNAEVNPSISIWYLLVLFAYCVIVPVLWVAVGGRFAVLLPLAAILFFVPLTERFYVGRIAHFLIFFMVGGWLAVHRERYYAIARRYWWAFMIAFVPAVIFAWRLPYASFYCGLLSMPAIHGLLMRPALGTSPVLVRIGEGSMAIYLMNTIFIGLAKLVWLHVLPPLGGWNVPFIVTLMIVGVTAPMIVRRIVDTLDRHGRVRHYLA